jgi:hypothetical protein
MKNLHLIPTDKTSELYAKNAKLKLYSSTMAMDWYISEGYKPHHIYITNSEEIKKGDWVLSGNKIYQIKESAKDFLNYIQGISKKIILTTDQDLIKDSVQAIDDEFLVWFVKNPSCESVEVELDEISFVVTDNIYKIIIPKEEIQPQQIWNEEKMKGIVKTRNFDSISKLSYKRAKGKKKNITKLNSDTHLTIITLEKLGLLTPELLWDLIERIKYLYIEGYKLEWVMRAREKNLPLYSDDIDKYVNNHSNVSIAVLRIPYEIRIIPEYKKYIWKRDIDENK